MGHFSCNILDQLLVLLTLFYFNLLAHTVDLGKLKSCGSAVVSILFSKDVNMFTQIMKSCEKNMINTFCISFSPPNYFRIILNTKLLECISGSTQLLAYRKVNKPGDCTLLFETRNTDCKFLKVFVLKAKSPFSKKFPCFLKSLNGCL